MPVDIPGFAYAAVVAAGGIMGYVKGNSIPSLGAGLFFGSLLGVGAYRISQDPNNFAPLLGTSVALGCLMGYRFYNTGKIMPAGIITLLSTAMVVRIAVMQLSRPVKLQ